MRVPNNPDKSMPRVWHTDSTPPASEVEPGDIWASSDGVIKIFRYGTGWDASMSGWNTALVTVEQAFAVTPLALVTELTIAVLASKVYEFEAGIIFRSAATTTGIALSMDAPANPTDLVYQKIIPTTLAAATIQAERAEKTLQPTTGIDTQGASTLATIKGILSNGVTAGSLAVWCGSEVDASAISIEPGSFLKIRRLN